MFGQQLKRHRESRGVSGYRICQVSGMPNPTFISIEKGRRPPSPANLEALAAVPELDVSLDQLKAWAALDAAGEEGIALIKTHAPEALSSLPIPPGVTLSRREIKIAEAIWELAGGFDGVIESAIWYMPPEDRFRELKFILRDEMEDAKDVGRPAREG